MKIRNKTQ